jgi:hypothetical protein
MVNYRKKALKFVDTAKDVSRALLGKDLSQAVNKRAVQAVQAPMSFAKGGKVPRTGMAKVHKGEVVLTAKQAASMKKLLK